MDGLGLGLAIGLGCIHGACMYTGTSIVTDNLICMCFRKGVAATTSYVLVDAVK